jgi:hypothetical protein
MLKQKILFTKEECDYIINLKNKYRLNHYRRLDENGVLYEPENFKNKYYLLEHTTDIDWIIKRLCDHFEKEMNLHIFFRPTKLNLHNYKIGDEFGKHIDTGNPLKEWNVGIILNEDFEGGDYVLYDENDNSIVIDKKIGNVCIFQSQTVHQVTPVLDGERWAIAMFLHKFRMNPSEKTLI